MSCSPLCDVRVSVAPWIYFTGFLVSLTVAWVLRDYGAEALDFYPVNGCLGHTSAAANGTSTSTSSGATCTGTAAVLRISFGNLLFFSLHLLLTLGVSRHSNKRLLAHTGFWPLQ